MATDSSDDVAKALWSTIKSAGASELACTASVQLATAGYAAGYYSLCRLALADPDLLAGAATTALPSPDAIVLKHHPATPPELRTKYESTVRSSWPLVAGLFGRPHGGAGTAVAAELPPRPAPLRAHVKLPALILLVGYPASGKSTFAAALLAGLGDRVQRVNKDDMRGKGEVDDVAGAAARAGKTVIVDNCNLTKCHRKAWVEWASGRSIWCVFFARDVGDCRERIVRRVGHPTLPTAAAGLRALGSLEGVLEPPAAAEGFEKLEVVLSDDGSNALAEEWGGVPVVEAETPSMDTGLMKFPRTPHLVNLGAATRDDKVLSPGEVALLLSSGKQVIVQEKVDGANLGLSISPEGKIRVQNRGHFVDASYHDQFKPLDKWVSRHTEELWELLGGDEPGRWILYGEWLHAKHSVAYSRLPDLFLAFDLYDRLRGEFVDHETLKARLAPTSIHIVPVLSDSPLRSVDDLLAMVRGPSAFSDGLREGVYVRICDGGRVVLRAKLVRPDFIAGNERWNKSKIEPNVVSPAAHA